VLADGDEAGEAAAEAAAWRWKRKWRRVCIARAPQGMDFNDLLLLLLLRGEAGQAGAP
jgi:putative DNA primase/helicase